MPHRGHRLGEAEARGTYNTNCSFRLEVQVVGKRDMTFLLATAERPDTQPRKGQ